MVQKISTERRLYTVYYTVCATYSKKRSPKLIPFLEQFPKIEINRLRAKFTLVHYSMEYNSLPCFRKHSVC